IVFTQASVGFDQMNGGVSAGLRVARGLLQPARGGLEVLHRGVISPQQVHPDQQRRLKFTRLQLMSALESGDGFAPASRGFERQAEIEVPFGAKWVQGD